MTRLIWVWLFCCLMITPISCGSVDLSSDIDGDKDIDLDDDNENFSYSENDSDSEIDTDVDRDPDSEYESDVDFDSESEVEKDIEALELEPVTTSYVEYLQEYCPWKSYCENDYLSQCFAHINDDDVIIFADAYKNNNFSPIYFPPISCYKNAKNCDDYFACENITKVDSCEKEYQRCNGDYFETCGNGRMYREDCSARGLSCVEFTTYDDTHYGCGLPEVTCAYDNKCFNNYAVWCPGDYRVVPILFDCTKFGKVCSNGMCIDHDQNQSADNFPCNDEFVVLKYKDMYATYDCHNIDMDLQCVSGDCLISDNPCENSDLVCKGEKAEKCMRGKKYEVDCSKIPGGFCDNGHCKTNSKSDPEILSGK